ncbi:anti-sigma factor [Polaribacter aestuariivivens]|uniref:Anti-sigma factor n=1 Tax=Polaribacter aestuariivivens TaxID=2304626 RepID=A0A5S3N755_9FLAO|nr:anti-sigma factor [Polaribacter aestuariivivens]TMM31123.1 anti-sigma factor [Polaribacter aestuariivivens]
MKKVLNLIMVFTVTIFFVSCNNNDDAPTMANLTVNLDGLEELGPDFVYEGWLIVNGNPVSTGTFTSVSFPQTYTVDINDLQNATKFVLSIEPAIDTDPAPAATKILAGDFSGNTATVNSDNIVVDANGTIKTLDASWGKYILATPTDTDDTNEASGIWFLDNSNAPPAVAGLGLPTLAAGWQYEGWVVLNGTPISTGTFTSTTEADSNAITSPFKGTAGNGPAFPGEDYLIGAAAGVNFPTDLKGATVVISVEPNPDNSTAPFTLKPLAHIVPSNANVHSVLNMEAGPKAILTGTVRR